mgnify:CR=1 FL=1
MNLTFTVLGDKVIQVKTKSIDIEKLYILLNEQLKEFKFITDISLSNNVIHILYHPLKAMEYYDTHKPLNALKKQIESIGQSVGKDLNHFNSEVIEENQHKYYQLHLIRASFFSEVINIDMNQLYNQPFKVSTFGYYPEEVIIPVELMISDDLIKESIDVQPNDIYYTDMGIHLVTKSYKTKGLFIGRIESTTDDIQRINVLDRVQFERLEDEIS